MCCVPVDLTVMVHTLSSVLPEASSLPGDLSAQESSETDKEAMKQQLQDPVLMPLPDSGADGPLDWAHLVDAAKAFEGTFQCGGEIIILT